MATVTTTTTTTSSPRLGISLDKGYVSTRFGQYNLVLVILNVINFICVAAQPWSAYIPPQGWFYFVCVTGFWTSLIDLLLGICQLQYRLARIVPWELGQLIFHGVWCFFYLTAASAVTHYAGFVGRDGWYAGTVFGFIATIVYGVITYFRFVNWKTAPVGATVTVQSVPA